MFIYCQFIRRKRNGKNNLLLKDKITHGYISTFKHIWFYRCLLKLISHLTGNFLSYKGESTKRYVIEPPYVRCLSIKYLAPLFPLLFGWSPPIIHFPPYVFGRSLNCVRLSVIRTIPKLNLKSERIPLLEE